MNFKKNGYLIILFQAFLPGTSPMLLPRWISHILRFSFLKTTLAKSVEYHFQADLDVIKQNLKIQQGQAIENEINTGCATSTCKV